MENAIFKICENEIYTINHYTYETSGKKCLRFRSREFRNEHDDTANKLRCLVVEFKAKILIIRVRLIASWSVGLISQENIELDLLNISVTRNNTNATSSSQVFSVKPHMQIMLCGYESYNFVSKTFNDDPYA